MGRWTEAQQAAIDSRKGTILVSAAAGSGKTSVLVQRVIERITDKENPTSVDNLLVVTFTKSAAAEMRERIAATLGKMIEEDPGNAFLRRQKMFLPGAKICTMDSFCSRLVKENFENLDISPDFSMMSDIEHEMLKRDIVTEVLDELYNEKTEDSALLLELFTNGKNDENLIKAICSIYDFAMAAPDPESWLDMRFKCYFDETPIEKSVWGEYALSSLKRHLKYVLMKAEKISLDAPEDGKLGETAFSDLNSVINTVTYIIGLIEENSGWDTVKNAVDSLKLGSFGRFSAAEKDDLFNEIKGRRDSLKSDFERAQCFMSSCSDEFCDDLKYLKPLMAAFKRAVIRFSEKLLESKQRKNSYYFSDILHLTLSLLIKRDENGNTRKTPLAEELSDTFDEILIDEFQDTNEAQNALFDAISKNGANKFMVGDVKQSIYRFRQAMPEIFIGYKDKYPDFTGENYPAKISLDRNFRSRRGVTDAVNFFFDSLMTREMGDIDYKDGEQLVFAADYSENGDEDAEVHIVEAPSALGSNLENESRYIGTLISDMIKSGMTVGRSGAERPIKYSDICILLRAVKTQAPVVARELTAMGIPVHYKKNGGFFDSAEIITLISMLRVIDNPVQDVPLMSVMLSPMFPFTEDDLAEMRCKNRKGSLYTLVKENSETDGKCRAFLKTVSSLRALSVTLSVSELIRRIFEITSYDSVVGAMENGEKRVLNLSMLISYADMYEQGGRYGLSGFIRYIDKLRKNNRDLESAAEISENDDVVRIMTVHKSKGLEFPVVILANCSGRFSADRDSKAIVNKELGVAALRYDRDKRKEFETQAFTSVKHKNNFEEMSESVRVLYVAMTRAKEKLLIVGSMYKPEDTIKKLYYNFYTGAEPLSLPMAYCSSFMQWIMLAMLSHPSMSSFVSENGLLGCRQKSTDAKIKVVFSVPPEIAEKESEEKNEVCECDGELLTLIGEKASYSYPHANLSGVPIKYTASSADREQDLLYLASENPAFLGVDELTPAQRGTLTHKFMEICDFSESSLDLEKEVRRLVSDGKLTDTEAKALNRGSIEKFFRSSLFRRIQSADRFLRETEFTLSMPLSEISDIDSGERAVVQGVIDGLIINGDTGEVVDYKTDRVSSEDELREKYRRQMSIYKRAAEECFGLSSVTVSLYSFSLSKEIFVKL